MNICLTYQSTANIVKKVSTDYDAEVKEWACRLKTQMEKPSQPVRVIAVHTVAYSIHKYIIYIYIYIYI